MKLSNGKAAVGKVLAMGLFAGVVALVAPAKAEAQRVAFGIQIGSPYYGQPGYYDGASRRDYWRHEQWERERAREAIARREAFERQRAWEQHKRWERERYYDRGPAYGYYGR